MGADPNQILPHDDLELALEEFQRQREAQEQFCDRISALFIDATRDNFPPNYAQVALELARVFDERIYSADACQDCSNMMQSLTLAATATVATAAAADTATTTPSLTDAAVAASGKLPPPPPPATRVTDESWLRSIRPPLESGKGVWDVVRQDSVTGVYTVNEETEKGSI